MRKLSFAAVFAISALLTGCSDTPTTPVAKKEPEKLEPVTGLSGLFKMYQLARSWGGQQPDIVKMQSSPLADVKDVPPGLSPVWMATFLNSAKTQSREYTFSITDGENLHKGAFAGPESGYSGPRGVNQPFPYIAVKVDSDAAYKTAMSEPKSKAADYDKKNPGKPIIVILEKTNKHPDPVWRIVWGESVGTSNFSVLIDATTGDYLETLR
jgi:hypothetical protein